MQNKPSLLSHVLGFLLQTEYLNTAAALAQSRVSALRMITIAALVLVCLVAIPSSIQAWHYHQPHVPILLIFFYLMTALLVWRVDRHYHLVAWGLLFTILMAGLSMQIFITESALANLGSLFLYAIPALAMLLLGLRVALLTMVFNILPFTLLLINEPLPNWFSIDLTLPNSHFYLHAVLFVFFNLAVPLAAWRLLRAFELTLEQRQKLVERLEHSRDLHKLVFESGQTARLLLDSRGRILLANQQASAMLAARLMPGMRLNDLLPVGLRPIALKSLRCKWTLDNEREWLVECQPLADSSHFLVQLEDDSERLRVKRLEKQARQLDSQRRWRDPLTGLPNLAAFMQQLHEKQQQQASPGLLAMIRVHRRSADKPGQQAIWLSQQLADWYQQGGFIGQWDVETLLLATPALTESPSPEAVYSALSTRLAALEGRHGQVSLCWGMIAPCPDVPAHQLLNYLRFAIEQAARSGEGYRFVLADFEEGQRDTRMLAALRLALQREQIRLAYQPQIHAPTGQWVGLEALARWHHPEWGDISPAKFCRLAEANGLSCQLTEAVLLQISIDWHRWHRAGLQVPPISINFSVHELASDQLLRHWLSLCKQLGLPPGALEIELTESALTEDESALSQRVSLLSRLGFPVVVDDFGVGYSSLARVITVPASQIKIDRSLIADIEHNTRQQKLIRSMVALCQTLDARLLVEGVETAAQLAVMEKLGCSYFQGYYFSRPVPAEQITPRLLSREPVEAI